MMPERRPTSIIFHGTDISACSDVSSDEPIKFNQNASWGFCSESGWLKSKQIMYLKVQSLNILNIIL